MRIETNNGRMTPRERVLCALERGIPDRVPVNYITNPTVHGRLAEHLGFVKTEMEGVLRALGVDFRGVYAAYSGSPLFEAPPGRQVDPVYGCIMRWVPNKDGGYYDFCDFPLKDAAPEMVEAFPAPSPDDFDYDTAADEIKAFAAENFAVWIGGAGHADIINATGRVMGMEDTLVNLQVEDEATLAYIDRRISMELSVLERLLDRSAADITFVWMGEDLGTQISPMISLDLYRRVFRPRHQRYIDLAKAYGKPVMVHTCGSSSWAYDDFVEMGVSAVDTLQPEAVNMSPAYLKGRFGDRLAFHGCISTAGPLAYGTAEDITKNVRETLEIMMPGGGYMLSPTHAIQDNTPVENIIAMYRAAREYGGY